MSQVTQSTIQTTRMTQRIQRILVRIIRPILARPTIQPCHTCLALRHKDRMVSRWSRLTQAIQAKDTGHRLFRMILSRAKILPIRLMNKPRELSLLMIRPARHWQLMISMVSQMRSRRIRRRTVWLLTTRKVTRWSVMNIQPTLRLTVSMATLKRSRFT